MIAVLHWYLAIAVLFSPLAFVGAFACEPRIRLRQLALFMGGVALWPLVLWCLCEAHFEALRDAKSCPCARCIARRAVR